LTAVPPVLLARPRAHYLYAEKLVAGWGFLCFLPRGPVQAQMSQVFAGQNDNDAPAVAALPQELFLQALASLILQELLPFDPYLRW